MSVSAYHIGYIYKASMKCDIIFFPPNCVIQSSAIDLEVLHGSSSRKRNNLQNQHCDMYRKKSCRQLGNQIICILLLSDFCLYKYARVSQNLQNENIMAARTFSHYLSLNHQSFSIYTWMQVFGDTAIKISSNLGYFIKMSVLPIRKLLHPNLSTVQYARFG